MQLDLSVVHANEKTVLFPRDDFTLEAFGKNPVVESKRRRVVLGFRSKIRDTWISNPTRPLGREATKPSKPD